MVSVIIPCFNQAEFLAEAVASVAAQTYPEWECIIVNDGSTDNTSESARKLIAEYADKNIRLLEKENGGLADARNAGIKEAEGAYILPLDSDDRIAPEMIEQTLRELESDSSVSFIYTDVQRFGRSDVPYNTSEYDINALKYSCLPNYCSLYRKKAWEDAGGYNANMKYGYEDWNFWLSLASAGHQGKRLPARLFFYRIRSGSMLSNTLKHDVISRAQIILNNRTLYSGFDIEWAEDVFAQPLSKKENALKILLVCHGFPPARIAGVELYTYNLAKALSKQGCKVSVLYPLYEFAGDSVQVTQTQTKFFTVCNLVCPRDTTISGHVKNSLQEDAFNEFILNNRFQIVHFHHLMGMPFTFLYIAARSGSRVFLTLHDFWAVCVQAQLFDQKLSVPCVENDKVRTCARCLLDARGRKMSDVDHEKITDSLLKRNTCIKKIIQENTDYISSPSDFVAREYKRRGYQAAVNVSPLGINCCADIKRKRRDRVLTFGHTGSLCSLKNQRMMIEAFRMVKADLKLLIYGSGSVPYVKEISDAALGDCRIEFHGAYRPDELTVIFNEIDILIVPSLIESYSLTVREALSCGIPVIAADVGGIPEAVRDGFNGLLFDPRSKTALAECIERFSREPSLLDTLRGNIAAVKNIEDDACEWIKRYSNIIISADVKNNAQRHAASEDIPVQGLLERFENYLDAGKYDRVKRMLADHIKDTEILTRSREIIDLYNDPDARIFMAVVPDKTGACPYLRVLAPASLLAQKKKTVYEVFSHEELSAGDYVILAYLCLRFSMCLVVQRYADMKLIKKLSLNRYDRLNILYETDDDLLNIQPRNPAYAAFLSRQSCIRELLMRASGIVVSTEALAHKFKQYNYEKDIHVFANSIDLSVWKPVLRTQEKDTVRIIYAGTKSHIEDLALIEGVLIRLNEKYGSSVKFVLRGCITPSLRDIADFQLTELGYRDYAAVMSKEFSECDIALSPLVDNEFNRCKSNIKFLEYSICRLPGVYSDVLPYSSTVIDGRNGFLAGTEEEWFDKLCRLIEDKQLREQIAGAACETVHKHYLMKDNYMKLYEIYQKVRGA